MFSSQDSALRADRVLHIHSAAPPKPAYGQACNGCGVCCLAAPCPLGMLLSRRRQGACAALVWEGSPGLYRCAAISQPRQAVQQALPRRLQWLARPLSCLLARLARRWIAAGQGCDSWLDVQGPTDIADNATTHSQDLHDR
ncbi:MAG: hypothetical protein WCH44_15875 [Betaproteobacteria bacterium]